MSQTILDRILETKRKEVAELHFRTTEDELRGAAQAAEPPRDFVSALKGPSRRPVRLIAEIKKASPSKGLIRPDFDPPTLAKAYQAAGADVLSVLTDKDYFQGSLDFLRTVRKTVDLPLLRKDFLIDEWQVLESRAAGADAILLIAAALPADRLMTLMRLADELGLATLVEIHNAEELSALRQTAGFPATRRWLIGVNNRDLATFHVDLRTTLDLCDPIREAFGDEVLIVGESGIAVREDVDRLANAGVGAILVGETFMRQADIGRAVEGLLGPKDG